MNLYEGGGFSNVALYNAPQAYSATQIRADPSAPAEWSWHDRKNPSDGPNRRYQDAAALSRRQSRRCRNGESCGSADDCHRSDAQGKRADRHDCDFSARGQAIYRQADRTCQQLRQSGGDRDREYAAAEAIARTYQRFRISLDDLRTAQDRLVQTEKLASLGQLTAGIAHEIKNPLNFVNNFSALSAELIDELNDVLKPAALDGKTPRGDRRTHPYAEGQSRKSRAARQARRFDRQEHAAAFARGIGRAPARRYQRDHRGEPQPRLSRRAGGKIRFQHHAQARFRPRGRHDRPLSAGNHAGVPQPDFERLLCRDQAQGRRARKVSSLP